jgi:hypothetical protein
LSVNMSEPLKQRDFGTCSSVCQPVASSRQRGGAKKALLASGFKGAGKAVPDTDRGEAAAQGSGLTRAGCRLVALMPEVPRQPSWRLTGALTAHTGNSPGTLEESRVEAVGSWELSWELYSTSTCAVDWSCWM